MSYVDEDGYAEDEDDDMHIPLSPPTLPEDDDIEELVAARQSGEHSLGGWHYAPLIVGLAPPLGAILGGGQADHWTDAILLVLSGFWLFQCLKVPHDIYYAARTRRILQQDEEEEEQDDDDGGTHRQDSQRARRRHMAIVELQRTEVIALAACIASPVVGAWLLSWLQANLHDGSRYLNQFNIRLFMMAAGIRPWIHMFKLIRRRLLLLQEDVHYPSAKVESLSRRIKRIEADLSSLRKSTASHSDVRVLRDGIDVPLSTMSRHLRRYEKREELHRSNSQDKFALVESRLEDLLRECAINAELIEAERIERERNSSMARNVLEAFKFAIGQKNTPPSAWANQHRQVQGANLDARALSGGGSNARRQHPSQGLPSADNQPQQPSQQPQPREWYSQGLLYWAFLPINLSNSILRSVGGGDGTAPRKLIGPPGSPPTSPPTSPIYREGQLYHRHANPAGSPPIPLQASGANGTRNSLSAPQLPPLQPTNLNINPMGNAGGAVDAGSVSGNGTTATASASREGHWKRRSRGSAK